MRFIDWIEKSEKTPRGESEVEANRKLRQPGYWWGYFNFGIVVSSVWQKNQKFSWKKQKKTFFRKLCWINLTNFSEIEFQMFSSNTPIKIFVNRKCVYFGEPEVVKNTFDEFFRCFLWNRKLSRTFFTNFSDVFFETGSCLEHF